MTKTDQMIPMQMNQSYVPPDSTGFAFTFELPAVPREQECVFVGGRRFFVDRVDYHPLTDWPVRVIATER